jgi:hypothetical protein
MYTSVFLLLLASSSAASVSLLEDGASSRKLTEEAHHEEVHSDAMSDTPFITQLGSESPLDHLLELYAASGSTEDVVAWLVAAARYVLSTVACCFCFCFSTTMASIQCLVALRDRKDSKQGGLCRGRLLPDYFNRVLGWWAVPLVPLCTSPQPWFGVT